MDLFNNLSDPFESQPTQILQNVLPSRSKVTAVDSGRVGRSKDGVSNRPENDINETQEFSSDSMIPPIRNIAPKYRFHGLAGTQSQNERVAQPDHSGARKGSGLTSSKSRHEAPTRPGSSSPPSITSLHETSIRHERPVSTSNTKDPQRKHYDSKVAPPHLSRSIEKNQPIPITNLKSMAAPTTRYPNSPPPSSSQDSFGGAVSQDDEKYFLASNKQFNVPLSDLGTVSTQGAPIAEETTSGPQEEMSFMSAAMLAYSAEKARESTTHSSNADATKIAGTPSYSASSSESSQFSQFAQSQSRNDFFHDQSYSDSRNHDHQESTQTFEFSQLNSSYERLLDRESSHGDIQRDSEPTQPSEPLQDTQPTELPATQPDDVEPNVEDNAIPGGSHMASSHLTPAAIPTVASSAPRSIFSMVNPDKKWRLDRMLKEHGDKGKVPPPSRSADTQCVPSFDATAEVVVQSSGPNDAHELNADEGNQPITNHRPRRIHVHSDTTEIIPDSEPTRAEQQASTPTHRSQPKVQTPVKRQVPQGKSRMNSPPGEVVDDSFEPTNTVEEETQDEDETEVPLAAVLSAKRSRAVKKVPEKVPSRGAGPGHAAVSNQHHGHSGVNNREKSAPVTDDEEEEEEEEEDNFEPTADDDMDVDSPKQEIDVGSRKRKRGADAKPLRAASRASTRTSKQSVTPAPSMRPAKRLRSVASASRTMSEPPTRVFALWKQDGHYYSGTVHSLQSPSSTRYLVKFDDNTEDVVDITRMRRCQLKVGDNVIMVEGGLRGKVTYADGLETEGVVRVEVDNGSKVITSEVETADIRIASRTLASQWKDRMLSAELIVAMVKPKPIKATPSPSKVSIQSTTSTKSESKVLAKTGLVVTLSATNSNRDADRDTVTSLIKSHGGVVIEEWSNIFLMNGTHSQGNKRWVALKDDIRWNPKYGIERVFLLSDDANQKPKFLIALALGIPCISFDWLLRGLKMGGEREKEWQSYLLPAGFSEVLHARVSQLIDMDWGNSPEHLSEIMYNPVASKLFSLKSVVCVGADFVPLPRAKKVNSDAERAKEASRTVPYIILAMGADRVEAVSDIKYASKSDLASFDYVVVKDNGEAGVSLRQDGVKLVHLSWVKDCLIAGRLLSMH